MKKINKYIIGISSALLIGVGAASGIVLGSNKLAPIAPTLNIQLTDIGRSFTPKDFVRSVVSSTGEINRQLLDSYVTGIPKEGNPSFAEINSNYITEVKSVSYNSEEEDGNSIEIKILFQSKFTSWSEEKTYKLEGLVFESQNLFNKLIVTPTTIASNVLPSSVNLRNYKQFIRTNIKNNFYPLKTTAKFVVESIQANDGLGSLNINLAYQHGNVTIKKQVSISGFQTSFENDNKKLEKYINSVKVIVNPNLAPITLPTEVQYARIRDYVTINAGTDVPLVGVKTQIIQSSLQPNNDNGQLKIRVKFQYNKSSFEKEFTLNGFQTIVQRRTQEIDQFTKNIYLKISRQAITEGITADQVTIANARAYIDGIPADSNFSVNITSCMPERFRGYVRITLTITGDDGREGLNTRTKTFDVYGFFIPAP